MKKFLFHCVLFFLFFVLYYCFIIFIFLKIKIWPIFSILGYLNAFCCLFVAKLPLTFAKLNSIPLNRARGPLNDNSNRLYGKAPQKDQACCALRTILSLQSLKHLTTKSLNVSPSGMLSNFVRATIATESNVIFCKFDIRIFHCPLPTCKVDWSTSLQLACFTGLVWLMI